MHLFPTLSTKLVIIMAAPPSAVHLILRTRVFTKDHNLFTVCFTPYSLKHSLYFTLYSFSQIHSIPSKVFSLPSILFVCQPLFLKPLPSTSFLFIHFYNFPCFITWDHWNCRLCSCYRLFHSLSSIHWRFLSLCRLKIHLYFRSRSYSIAWIYTL